MGIKAGNLPTSTIDNTDYLLITEGEAPKRVAYSDVKNDIIGNETLTTNSQTVKGAINEIDLDIGDKTTLTTTNKTSLVNAINENVTSLSEKANKSLLINDCFQVWQRGASGLTGAGYSADRWYKNDSSFPCEVLKDADGLIVRSNTGSTDANSMSYIRQPIEGKYSLLKGKKVTASCLTPNNFSNLFIRIGCNVGGVFTELAKTSCLSNQITQITATIPTGIDENTLDVAIIWNKGICSAGTSFLMKYIKLELGSTATPFVPRPIGEEEMLCKRYYNSFSNLFFLQSAVQDGGGNYRAMAVYPFGKMRVIPTATVSSYLGTTNKVTVGDNGVYGGDPANIDSSVNAVVSPTIDTLFVVGLHNAMYHYIKFNVKLDAEIY